MKKHTPHDYTETIVNQIMTGTLSWEDFESSFYAIEQRGMLNEVRLRLRKNGFHIPFSPNNL